MITGRASCGRAIVGVLIAGAAIMTACGSSGSSRPGPTQHSDSIAITRVAKTWLNISVQEMEGDDTSQQRVTCANPPVGLNFKVPRVGGKFATVGNAQIVSRSTKPEWQVATRWSTGAAGPTLAVVQERGAFLVCGGRAA